MFCEQVGGAFLRVVDSASQQRPDARIEGVTIQPMFMGKGGIELVLGARKDPCFGMVTTIGVGGAMAELLAEPALGLPPLNERLARRIIETQKWYPILTGQRGKPAVAVDELIEIMVRLSYLVADHPEIERLEIDPLIVTPSEVVALDAKIAINRETLRNPPSLPEHLAIPPYPEHFERRAKIRDDTPVLLRPIKPEDEPMWHDLLAQCSAESIRGRFHSLFHGTTHDMAARACCIDYDREIAIVAEIGKNDQRKLIGVTRIVADAEHDTADFGILIADPWQSQGIGRLLTEYCVEIAQQWQLRRVTAITSASNPRMVKIFKNLGFSVEREPDDDVVIVNKVLK